MQVLVTLQMIFLIRQVVARIDEAELHRVEASLAEEENNLASLTERKTTSDHKIAMAKRELTQRSRDAEKLKLVSLSLS